MSTQSATPQSAPNPRKILDMFQDADKITAIVIWLIGVITTRQALIEVGFTETTGSIAALGLQWILTRVERRVWLGKIGVAPIIALTLDTLANAAGMFPYILHFGQTGIWGMLQTAFQSQTPFTTTAALSVSISLGYAIARLPEQLWSE